MTNKFKDKITVDGKDYSYYSIEKAKGDISRELDRLPKSLKILLENNLRKLGNGSVSEEDIKAFFKVLILI